MSLKDINLNLILNEIKNARKGTFMIVIFICIMCAIIDIFLRKYNMTFNWFTQTYLITGFIATCAWGIKLFNNIADIVDEKKRQKQILSEYLANIEVCLEIVEPILNNLDKNLIKFLMLFYKKHSHFLVVDNTTYNMNTIIQINSIMNNCGQNIEIAIIPSKICVRIDREYYNMLVMYFEKQKV